MIRSTHDGWKAPIARLGSSMALLKNVTKRGKVWSRRDAIRSAQVDREIKDWIATERMRRAQDKPEVRYAVVTRHAKHYHVVGVGRVRTETFKGLKHNLSKRGYTHIRLGGVKFEIK
jgi:hypothetical protein